MQKGQKMTEEMKTRIGFQKGHKCFTKRKDKTLEEAYGLDKARIWKENSHISHLGQHPWNKDLTKETEPRLLKSSKIMFQKTTERLLKNPEQQPNRILAKRSRTGTTTLERIIGNILDSGNILFEPQKLISYKGKWKFVDFYLPNHKLIIECDGERWHQNLKKDEERDKIILAALGEGWRIEHLSEKEIYEFKEFFGIKN